MNKDATRIGVYGASGSGKSTRVKVLLQGAARVVVFDPLGEYARPIGRMAACASIGDVLDGLQRGWQRGFQLSYRPRGGFEAESLHQLSKLLLQAQQPYFEGRASAQLTLVVEEMNLSFPVAALPRELWGFSELCSRGRHYGVNIIGVTQRLSEISTRFRGNTIGGAYIFMPTDHTDATTAARMLGPKWAQAVRELQPHQYLFLKAGQVTAGRNELKRKRA